MQSLKPASTHWSVHPWKLSGVLAVGLPIGASIGAVLVLAALARQTLSIGLMLPALQDIIPKPDSSPSALLLWLLPFLVLILLAYVFIAVYILRTQARHGLQDQAQNRISWIALPSLLVAVALSVLDLLVPLTWDPSVTGRIRLPVLSMLLPAVHSTLLAAALLPVWRRRTRLTFSTLFLAAINFAPALLMLPINLVLGKGEPLFSWIFVQPALSLTGALVTAALFWAAGRRLWDALALQWGLMCLIEILAGLWNRAGGAAGAGGQNDIPHLVLWAAPALVALVYLLVRDRQSAKGPPSVAALEITELND